MKTIKYSWILVAIFALVCCDDSHVVLLRRAEKLVETSPDSAYLLLQMIDSPEQMPEEAQANYYLMMSEALHMKRLPLNDSVIVKSLSFFHKQHDNLKEGRCHFLHGTCLHDVSPTRALEEYQKSLEIAEKNRDYVFAGMSCDFTAALFRDENAYLKALDYSKRALSYYTTSGSLVHQMYALKNMAIDFSLMHQYDSALVYFEQSFLLIDKGKMPDRYIENMLERVICYNRLNEYDKAHELFLQIEFLPDSMPGKGAYYNALADMFAKNQDRRRAIKYYQMVLNDSSAEVRMYAHYQLYNLYKADKNVDNAMFQLEQYLNCDEIVKHEKYALDIIELDKRYNWEKIYKETQRDRYIFVIVFISFIFFTFVLSQRQRYKQRHAQAIMNDLLSQKTFKLNLYEEQLAVNETKIMELQSKLEEGMQTQEVNRRLQEEINQLSKANQKIDRQFVDQKELLNNPLYRKAIQIYDRLKSGPLNMDDKDYEVLISLFQYMYPEFFNRLPKGSMTKSEIELCSLWALGFNNQAISQIRHTLLNSIISSKYIIRKKMKSLDMSEYASLILG